MNPDDLADRAIQIVDGSSENTDGMEWYVVGGGVRDALRGIAPTDIDFVVVGESVASMKGRGFRLVDSENNDTFPVFLNSNGEEFALARTERSTGDGHTEFTVDAGSAVTLEEDLHRRDFTINAIALSPDGDIIDPHDGCDDLENNVIRAVDKDSFKTDSLRIIRAARFSARLEFEIEPTTKKLMEEVVDRL